uniref:Putative ovule protein n=1 Tax=Solanum chacoense TaxID=4108 RepID=A0A0V0I3J7_SOLCH
MNFISILRKQRITSAIHQTIVVSLSKQTIHSCHIFCSKISDANFTSENSESEKEERLVDQGMVATRNNLSQRIESILIGESV